MKKLILSVVMLTISSFALAQNFNQKPKSVTFQVAPSVFSYQNNVVMGYQIGMNVKEKFNLSFYAMRDYDFSDSIKDFGWRGLTATYMLNLTDYVDFGPVVRIGMTNENFEKPYFGAEVRYALSEKLKLSFEYGQASGETSAHTGYGMKLIWNMY